MINNVESFYVNISLKNSQIVFDSLIDTPILIILIQHIGHRRSVCTYIEETITDQRGV